MKVYSLGIRPLQEFRLGTDRNLAENSWCNFQIGFSWKFFSHRPNSATHLASQRQPMPVCNCGPDCHNFSLSMAVRQYHEDTSYLLENIIFNALRKPDCINTSLTCICHKPKLILPSNFSISSFTALEYPDIVTTVYWNSITQL